MALMVSDHVGPETGIGRLPAALLDPGLGFGLGVSVRLGRGAMPIDRLAAGFEQTSEKSRLTRSV